MFLFLVKTTRGFYVVLIFVHTHIHTIETWKQIFQLYVLCLNHKKDLTSIELCKKKCNGKSALISINF